eukprot:9473458-Pyramimonas_sp.AAC.6
MPAPGWALFVPSVAWWQVPPALAVYMSAPAKSWIVSWFGLAGYKRCKANVFQFIATDTEFLQYPVQVREYDHNVAERYEYMLDFEGCNGLQVVLMNDDAFQNNKPFVHTNKIARFDVAFEDDNPVERTDDDLTDNIPCRLMDKRDAQIGFEVETIAKLLGPVCGVCSQALKKLDDEEETYTTDIELAGDGTDDPPHIVTIHSDELDVDTLPHPIEYDDPMTELICNHKDGIPNEPYDAINIDNYNGNKYAPDDEKEEGAPAKVCTHHVHVYTYQLLYKRRPLTWTPGSCGADAYI